MPVRPRIEKGLEMTKNIKFDNILDFVGLSKENLGTKEDEEIPEKRRVFNFGDTKESVDEQLYEYDLALKYKENKVTR